jgi:drug/metabolite transporter (DMT)-like permease|tara:strand:- start:89 stop:991 length:903 start_codon:yes stop_codon:yes gene_type:complete
LSEFIFNIEGTEYGRNLALWLVLIAAVLHASFGALQKGRHDPWLSRGSIDINYFMIMLPVALFVVPWPEPKMWPIFFCAWLIHTIYKWFQAEAYSRGAYTVVYPIVRGTSPILTIFIAGILFGEKFSIIQWVGVLTMCIGIFGIALYNLFKTSVDRDILKMAIILAILTGVGAAAYTAFDAYGIRQTVDPFTFIAWLFVFDGVVFPIIAIWRLRNMTNIPTLGPLYLRGLCGGIIAILSFGAIMMATRLDKVGEAAVLRETSTIFAAIIGYIFLKETVGIVRFLMIALIAIGAVTVELGS